MSYLSAVPLFPRVFIYNSAVFRVYCYMEPDRALGTLQIGRSVLVQLFSNVVQCLFLLPLFYSFGCRNFLFSVVQMVEISVFYMMSLSIA